MVTGRQLVTCYRFGSSDNIDNHLWSKVSGVDGILGHLLGRIHDDRVEYVHASYQLITSDMQQYVSGTAKVCHVTFAVLGVS